MAIAQGERLKKAEFAQPWEFLGEFVEEGTPYEGLYTFFANQLDLGNEAAVRDYVSGLALDVRDQMKYTALLDAVIEQIDGPYTSRVKEPLHPPLIAAANYLKYRLAVGIMEPAISTALDRTAPSHTNVRITRTIVAADMTRGVVNDTFAGYSAFSRITGFLDREAESELNQRFNGVYQGTQPELADKFLGSGFALAHVGPDVDDFRLFDIKDLSHKSLFSISKTGRNGGTRLPTTDELDEILERQKAAGQVVPWTSRRQVDDPAVRQISAAERQKIARRTIAYAFNGLGVLKSSKDLDVTSEERMIPSHTFEGRLFACNAVTQLLNRLERGGKLRRVDRSGKTELAKCDQETVTARLVALLRLYDGSMPADAYFALCYDAYIARYGEPPSRRDFDG